MNEPNIFSLSSDFRSDLQKLLNKHCKERQSDTPDYILVDYLIGCLSSFNAAVNERENWYTQSKEQKEECLEGWQPIETAPKDGRVIDLYDENSIRRINCYFAKEDWWYFHIDEEGISKHLPVRNPKYWHPIP